MISLSKALMIKRRSEFELKQLSKFWLDLAKIALASLAIKLFEPEVIITLGSLIFALGGLIAFLICARVGLVFAKEVKET